MISYFSFYHSSLFVLGSVLSWAVIARSLTCGPVIKTIISLGKANSNSVNIKMVLILAIILMIHASRDRLFQPKNLRL